MSQQAINNFAGQVLGVTTGRTNFLWEGIRSYISPFFFIDIIIVAVLFYLAYIFLKETRAARILYGFLVLLAIALIGKILDLLLLNWILKYLTTMLVVAIPIVFQPELRSALEKLGRARFIKELTLSKGGAKLIDDIVGAVAILSKNKMGALIVIQRQTGLREYIETGIDVDATVSKEMLLSIFFPKSPLHDGAAIIVGDKIVSARSILPVSETVISPTLGTRHKAGIGITESSDAVSVIVSEETGAISIAVSGKIERRITDERLKNKLIGLLRKF